MSDWTRTYTWFSIRQWSKILATEALKVYRFRSVPNGNFETM